MKSSKYVTNADSPILAIYNLCKDVTDKTIAEAKIYQGNNNPIQLEIPIILGDDMILTISRGPETVIAIKKFKEKNAKKIDMGSRDEDKGKMGGDGVQP